MKKTILILLVLFVISGCSIQPKPENKSSDLVKKVDNGEKKQETNTDKSDNSKNVSPLDGEKIEKLIEVKFEPNVLPSGWVWIDPDKENNPANYETKNGALIIKSPTGRDLFGDDFSASRVVKSISGNFEIETKVKFDPRESYQGAGLLVWEDEKRFLRLERGIGGTSGQNNVRYVKIIGEGYIETAPEETNTESKEVELKIIRKGRIFIGYWRERGSEWKEIDKFEMPMRETVQVGFAVCNTAQDIAAEFSNVKISPPKE